MSTLRAIAALGLLLLVLCAARADERVGFREDFSSADGWHDGS
jgi:hypothetical protein